METEKTILCPHCEAKIEKPKALKRDREHEAYLMRIALKLLKNKVEYYF